MRTYIVVSEAHPKSDSILWLPRLNKINSFSILIVAYNKQIIISVG